MKKSQSCASIQTELAAYAAHAYASPHTILRGNSSQSEETLDSAHAGQPIDFARTSPEGTSENSPAALAPGTPEPNPTSPGGTAENHASNSRNTPLPESIKHHLASCPACQRAFADLQRAASIQFQTAVTLPTPQTNPNLHLWLAHKISNIKSAGNDSTPRPLPTFHWRPILVTTFALITLVAIVALFNLLKPADKTTVVQTLPPQPSAQTTPLPQPTLISLRHQIGNPADQFLPPENPAAPLTHYRLIDAHHHP